jgi:hypothetical protein
MDRAAHLPYECGFQQTQERADRRNAIAIRARRLRRFKAARPGRLGILAVVLLAPCAALAHCDLSDKCEVR